MLWYIQHFIAISSVPVLLRCIRNNYQSISIFIENSQNRNNTIGAICNDIYVFLRKIKFRDNNFINEEIIFKGNIGRIRDIKIQEETGDLYMLSDNGSLWRIFK